MASVAEAELPRLAVCGAAVQPVRVTSADTLAISQAPFMLLQSGQALTFTSLDASARR